jgi:hypothetical protein
MSMDIDYIRSKFENSENPDWTIGSIELICARPRNDGAGEPTCGVYGEDIRRRHARRLGDEEVDGGRRRLREVPVDKAVSNLGLMRDQALILYFRDLPGWLWFHSLVIYHFGYV